MLTGAVQFMLRVALVVVERNTNMKYRIVRKHFDNSDDVLLETGLTLKQAQKHCSDLDTSSRTCNSRSALLYTQEHGPWFDCYYAEDE
jgi:hypothetical protein